MQNRIKIMRFCNAVIADLYEKSNLKKSLNSANVKGQRRLSTKGQNDLA